MSRKSRKDSQDVGGFRGLHEPFDDLFIELIWEDRPEALATAIESGRNLNEISAEGREVLARLVRGRSPRKRGQKLADYQSQSRHRMYCTMIAYYHGATGLPFYGGKEGNDCVSLVAADLDIPYETLEEIWKHKKSEVDVRSYIEGGKRSREGHRSK